MRDERDVTSQDAAAARDAAAVAAVVRAAREPDRMPMARAVDGGAGSSTTPVDDDTVPLIRASAGRSARMRWIGAAVAVGCGVVLGVAAWARPSEHGVGTHEQLGLPPCGFLLVTGLPCPTCGMTSAFSWMMHGHPLRSAACQPLGALMCFVAIAGVCVGAWMAGTGRGLEVDWVRFSPAGLMLGIAATFFLAWGVKIAYGLATGELPYRR